MPTRSSRRLPIASVGAGLLAISLAAIGKSEPAPSPVQEKAGIGSSPDAVTSNLPLKFYQAKTCGNGGCHGDPPGKSPDPGFYQGNEFASWDLKDKHSDAFEALKKPLGKLMADRMQIDVSIEPRCLACHAPAFRDPTINDDTVRKAGLLKDGVGCASCHGPHEEWVTAHAAPEKQEAWVAKAPAEKRDKFGMNDLRDPAVRTKVCASCHIGSKEAERVVTHDMYAAGHPPLPGLEVATFSEAEPPHWLPMKDVPYLNQSDDDLTKRFPNDPAILTKFVLLRRQYKVDEFPTQYAKLVAVGGLVSFRESMKLFADMGETYKGKGNPEFARFACSSCHHDLTVWQDSFRQARGFASEPGRPPAPDWPAALAYIGIAAGNPEKIKDRVKTLQEGLKRFHTAVGDRPFGNPKLAIDEARALATWADDVIKELGARKLDRAGTLRILNRIVEIAPPDHASARQLAWAFRAVYEEMNPKPANDAEIKATIKELIDTLGINLTPGEQGGIQREVGARLDADDKFQPDRIAGLFQKLQELIK